MAGVTGGTDVQGKGKVGALCQKQQGKHGVRGAGQPHDSAMLQAVSSWLNMLSPPGNADAPISLRQELPTVASSLQHAVPPVAHLPAAAVNFSTQAGGSPGRPPGVVGTDGMDGTEGVGAGAEGDTSVMLHVVSTPVLHTRGCGAAAGQAQRFCHAAHSHWRAAIPCSPALPAHMAVASPPAEMFATIGARHPAALRPPRAAQQAGMVEPVLQVVLSTSS